MYFYFQILVAGEINTVDTFHTKQQTVKEQMAQKTKRGPCQPDCKPREKLSNLYSDVKTELRTWDPSKLNEMTGRSQELMPDCRNH